MKRKIINFKNKISEREFLKFLLRERVKRMVANVLKFNNILILSNIKF